MIGATIQIKGEPGKGTLSDYDGNFEMEVPSESIVLEVRYMGFNDKEITVGNQRQLIIRLTESNVVLQEAVVTALGVVKEKKILGYAVQELKGGELNVSRDANPFSSMIGKVSGLQIAVSTDLLQSPKLLLRGEEPLIVVDGVPVASDTWNVSPDDIENITVLKGPTASALYGSYGKTELYKLQRNGQPDKKINYPYRLTQVHRFRLVIWLFQKFRMNMVPVMIISILSEMVKREPSMGLIILIRMFGVPGLKDN